MQYFHGTQCVPRQCRTFLLLRHLLRNIHSHVQDKDSTVFHYCSKLLGKRVVQRHLIVGNFHIFGAPTFSPLLLRHRAAVQTHLNVLPENELLNSFKSSSRCLDTFQGNTTPTTRQENNEYIVLYKLYNNYYVN